MPEQEDEAPQVPPEAPPERPPRTPTERLRRAMVRPSRRQIVAGVLMALLGFAAVTQVRVAGTDESYAGLREQELIDLLNALAGTRQRAEAEIDRLEEVATDLRDDTTKRQAALEQAQSEVDALNVLAGLVPVTGPGVRITITEEEGRVRLGSLLDVVQELRTVGAESIAINGTVRVVAQTAIAETDGGFRVDGEPIEAPYVIDAIGDPGALRAAIVFPLGPQQQVQEDGGRIDLRELRAVDIEVVSRRDEPRYSLPDQGQ